MEKLKLNANFRTVFKRKVKKLREKGMLPANLYGKKIKSQAVELNLSDFKNIYKKAGETKVVDLTIGSDIKPILIQNVQINPLTRVPYHADFYQVDLTQKVKAEVSIEPLGKSPAVEKKIGILLQTLNKVEIEALPTDLPEKILFDISKLEQINQELKVLDLKVPSSVTILTDVNLVVVKIGALVSKEAEELAKQEEAAAAAKLQQE